MTKKEIEQQLDVIYHEINQLKYSMDLLECDEVDSVLQNEYNHMILQRKLLQDQLEQLDAYDRAMYGI